MSQQLERFIACLVPGRQGCRGRREACRLGHQGFRSLSHDTQRRQVITRFELTLVEGGKFLQVIL